jgi:hypothetical protein
VGFVHDSTSPPGGKLAELAFDREEPAGIPAVQPARQESPGGHRPEEVLLEY